MQKGAFTMQYNTKEEILAELGSYEAFYKMMKARHEYGKSSKSKTKKLTYFVILGGYISDEGGRCMRLNTEIFTSEKREKLPKVMTGGEFDNCLKNMLGDERIEQIYEGMSGMTPPFILPSPQYVCSECGQDWKGWKGADWVDIVTIGGLEDIQLSYFAGMTLEEAEKKLCSHTLTDFGKAKNGWRTIYNMKDHDDDSYNTLDELVPKKVSKSYILQDGDLIRGRSFAFYHGACYRAVEKEYLLQEEDENIEGLRELLVINGFGDVKLTKVALPEHMIAWIDHDMVDEGEDEIEEAVEAFQYYQIETKQGNFGVAYASYPLLDLTGTGISIKELNPDWPDDVPAHVPPVCGFTGGNEQLLKLWQLMVKKHIGEFLEEVARS